MKAARILSRLGAGKQVLFSGLYNPFNPIVRINIPFSVKGGDPAALSSTATLLRLHPPH